VQPAIQVVDLTVEFNGVLALDNVSFEAGPGTLVSVVGPNGSGKSTLIRALVGLVAPTNGSIRINGLSPVKARGQIAYVPQREQINWRFPITAGEVVMQGRARSIGLLRLAGRSDKLAVQRCLERVRMDDRAGTLVQELSGGQRQRIFVARALAQEANIILLDEAMSGVDVVSQDTLFSVFGELRDEGKTVAVATHDLAELADRYDTCLCLNCRMCGYGPVATTLTPAVMEQMYGASPSHIHHHVAGGSDGSSDGPESGESGHRHDH
jgi:ABC-type Mn2+/Zn2+ transport system ATPase subunit